MIYRDILVPHARATEVWFGFELTGTAAAATAPLHWAIFATGAWAFWRGRRWIWSASLLYVIYIAVSHLIWNLISPSGGGLWAGLWQLVLFSAPAFILLHFRPTRGARGPIAPAA